MEAPPLPPSSIFFFHLIELSYGSYKKDVISLVLLGVCAEGTTSCFLMCMNMFCVGLLFRQKVFVLVEFKLDNRLE